MRMALTYISLEYFFTTQYMTTGLPHFAIRQIQTRLNIG